MKRERCEPPEPNAECKRCDTAELSFYAGPCLRYHTWHTGYMDLVADLGGEPFAYMVVRDGLFDDQMVYRNAQCVLWKTIGCAAEHQLFVTLHNQIVAGCRALAAALQC